MVKVLQQDQRTPYSIHIHRVAVGDFGTNIHKFAGVDSEECDAYQLEFLEKRWVLSKKIFTGTKK